MTPFPGALGQTEVVAASAGTGKTFRLAELLKEELLATPPMEPERVVAMTYTRAAAAELDARVRRALIEAGQPRLARRLGAARIGTVHAVCARIVSDHAFDLGLSPELETLDDVRALHAVREALEQEVSEDERAQLEVLDSALGGFEWQAAAKQIIDAARLNGLEPADIERCAERSAAGLAAVLPPSGVAVQIEADLLRLIDQVLAGAVPRIEGAREEWHALHDIRRTLRRGEAVPWSRWLRLGDAHMLVLRRFEQEHLQHPQLRLDLVDATRLVFAIASRALRRYEEEKRRWGVFDFVDQETLVLRVLRDPALRPALKEQIGLVLVDEFQDTSPLQLAILTELSSIAERSVFVGDQKQAIYGFRGTDPALMRAVVEALDTAHTAPLDRSYRSRPGLVAVTSSLFTPGFAGQGISADRVKVRAALDTEPPGLGVFLERWRTSGFPRDAAREIAAGIAELLADDSVMIREGDEVVRAQPRHIAVLVRTNDHGAEIAQALSDAGIAAVRRRRGLAITLEARALAAGLSLFVDGRDPLAAAEIARLTRGAGDPHAWLAQLVTAPRGEAFLTEPLVDAVRKVGETARDAGVVAAVDLVVEALRLREVCAAWGEAEQRWANLGALRALATRFVRERTAMGTGATLPGFLARVAELAALQPWEDDPDDEQGEIAGQDAVDVVTWHKSKGKEWPIVVLGQLGFQRTPSAFGVHVESDMVGVDLKDPLRGRWVRYWPSPYGRAREGGLIKLLDNHGVQQGLQQHSAREELRLLYVGWTRARDRVVLPGGLSDVAGGRFCMWSGPRSLLRHLSDGATALLHEPGEPDEQGIARVRWAGHDVAVRVRLPQPARRGEPPVVERSTYAPIAARTYAPATLQPSSLASTGVADVPVVLGPPLLLQAFADMDTMALLGSAVHGFLAADAKSSGASGEDIDDNGRFRLAESLLARFGVVHLLRPDDLVTMGDRLWQGLAERFPGARLLKERPITQRLEGGTVVRGIIDLVVETNAGLVVLDHKTYITDDARATAATFAGQLGAYARALAAATGKPILELLVHMPLSGVLVVVR